MGADKPSALELLASKCRPYREKVTVSNIALLLQGTKHANVVQYLDADVVARHTALGIGASPAELALAVFRNQELRSRGIETFLYTIDPDTHHVVAVSKVGNERYVVHDFGYHLFDDAILVTNESIKTDPYLSMLDGADKNPVTLVDIRRDGAIVKVERYKPRNMVIKYPELYSFDLDAFQIDDQVKEALADSTNLPNDSVYLRQYVPKTGTEAAHFIECSVRHGSTNGYKVRKIETGGNESKVDIRDIDHFCELFGIEDRGIDLLRRANRVAMANGGYNLKRLWR